MAIVSKTSNFIKYGRPTLAWLIGLLFFFPIFWMVLTSFKSDADAVKPEYLIWFNPTLDNYLNMTENYDYWRFAKNSVITAVFATTFTLFVSIPSAYAMGQPRPAEPAAAWLPSAPPTIAPMPKPRAHHRVPVGRPLHRVRPLAAADPSRSSLDQEEARPSKSQRTLNP